MSTKVKLGNKEFDVVFYDELKSAGSVNGKEFDWDVQHVRNNIYHVLKNNRSYNVEVLEPEEGKTRLKVNGNIYTTETIDKFDALLKSMGMEKAAGAKVNELKAPMPGMVLEVSVEPGAEVAKGDRLLVLEAMKMENVIKAPADATVASIEVEKGNSVEKNQVMIRFS